MPDEPATDAAPDETAPRGAAAVVRWPWLRDDRPRSVRYPWTRTVLGALLGALLPFVWVVEVEECGSHAEEELTGAQLVAQLEPAEPGVWAFGLFVVLSLAAPWIAAAMVREAPRVWAHVAGLVASLVASSFVVAMMFLTVFSHRTLRLAGNVALLLLLVYAADAIARLGLGVHEWLTAGRGRAPPT